jgi:hypothetical protein
LDYNSHWKANEITAIAGAEAWENSTYGTGNRLYGYDPATTAFTQPATSGGLQYPAGEYLYLTPQDNTYGITTDLLNRFRSYFGNAAYTYKNRYTVSASGRIDGSNLFGVNTNQKSVPLWSTGIKWDVDREGFYHIDWLPILKLRATYGYNGNLNNTLTAYTTAQYTGPATLTGLSYANDLTAPNANLRWEKDRVMNAGVDFGLKKNMLSGHLDYYMKKGTDLIGDETLAPSSGYVNPSTGGYSYRGNFAAMTGHGLDLDITSKNIDRSFKWTTCFLLSFNTDKVTRYEGTLSPESLVQNPIQAIYPVVRRSVNSLFSYKWGGLDQNGNPQGYINKGLSTNYGSLITPDSLSDIVYSGPSRPTIFGGLNNAFTWKSWTLLVNISYKMHYYFRRTSINYYGLFYDWAGNKDFSRRWQKPGDEKSTSVPAMTYPDNQSRDEFYTYSEVLATKGDQVRLQDVSLSYNLGRRQWAKLPFTNLQVYLYANNLGIIWRANKEGLDPDVVTGSYPNPRTIAAGIKASF